MQVHRLQLAQALECTHLVQVANKPKIFIFQSCRGNLDDEGVSVEVKTDRGGPR